MSKTNRRQSPAPGSINKNEKEHNTARLEKVKKIDKKQNILLPPLQEKYIKIKKHDFR
ncbi:MAG: hypothetical protein ACXWWC_01425 [Chitinophagaceae bacterium]